MSQTSKLIDPVIGQYLRELALTRESAALRQIRDATVDMPDAQMQIAVEQGELMAVLVRLLGVRRAIEVGTFTGYSALAVAQALPADGKLVACDVSDEWTAVGKPMWQAAGVADRIDLRLGPASKTLQAMIDTGEAGQYDFAFIDADKAAYDGYYEQCLTLLRPGGALTMDNMFMGGQAADPNTDHASSQHVRKLTEKIYADPRVDPAMLPIADGVLLARKR